MPDQPRVRARRLAPDERRAQILRAADEIFRSHPYDEVSLDSIAEAAGITRGLINHHFGTKRELYVEVVRRLMRIPELPVPAFVQGGHGPLAPDESVGRWLDAIERNRDSTSRRSQSPDRRPGNRRDRRRRARDRCAAARRGHRTRPGRRSHPRADGPAARMGSPRGGGGPPVARVRPPQPGARARADGRDRGAGVRGRAGRAARRDRRARRGG
ncbi:MAG: helix-turn-helix transcriptional regulator [Actinobacteria bacterium]|nr:helix-turn-helix transcriptional regulator [Actinomycetota bacterium]